MSEEAGVLQGVLWYLDFRSELVFVVTKYWLCFQQRFSLSEPALLQTDWSSLLFKIVSFI